MEYKEYNKDEIAEITNIIRVITDEAKKVPMHITTFALCYMLKTIMLKLSPLERQGILDYVASEPVNYDS